MALPRDAMGLSAVCDCGIPDNTHLLFLRKSEHAPSLCRETGEQVHLFEGGVGQV